jgi:hypothetical protein
VDLTPSPRPTTGTFTPAGGLSGGVKARRASAAASSSTLAAISSLETLGGAVVTILNLGVSRELAGLLANYSSMASHQASYETAASGEAVGAARARVAALVADGNVLFNDNQVLLESSARRSGAATSAVLILSLDDVSMSSNQSDCDVLERLISGTIVFGWSARVNSNRFKETIGRASLSALTAAFMNTTVDNIGTHCIIAVPITPKVTAQPNHSLLFNTDGCLKLGEGIASLLAR